MDDRRPTSPHHELGEPIGSDAAPVAETVQHESPPVVYCGTDLHGGATFLPVGIALATNTPNTEDD